MDFPFGYEYTQNGSELLLTIKNGKRKADMTYYGFETKVDDAMMKRILDGMYTDAVENCSREPMPSIRTVNEGYEDTSYGEWHEFMRKVMSIMDKATAKTLAIQMWGVKK